MFTFRRVSDNSSLAGAGRHRACVPGGCRVYAVGDIHGRSDLLERLHDEILQDVDTAPPQRVVVYLGDYVDRGAGSYDVLDMLIGESLPGFQSVYLKGNHEDMMLRFLKGPADVGWLLNGGDMTMSSYGIALCGLPVHPDELEAARRRLDAAVPASHRRFLEDLDLYHIEGDYLFVHAGIRPGVALADQRPSDLMWIRDPFLTDDQYRGRRVVHGHSISRRPEVTVSRIGIDTGAFFSDRLTCVVLEGDAHRFLST